MFVVLTTVFMRITRKWKMEWGGKLCLGMVLSVCILYMSCTNSHVKQAHVKNVYKALPNKRQAIKTWNNIVTIN